MKKEFGAEDYVRYADGLLLSMHIVVSNLAFNAAGLNEGEEDLHLYFVKKFLKEATA